MIKHKDNQRQSAHLNTMVYGKVPPHAKDTEATVLGALMLERGVLAEVQDLLTPEKFYSESHQLIYRAILETDGNNQPVDVETVVAQLARTGNLEKVGGAYAVVQLTNSVVSAANIEAHARIIVERHMSRELIRIGGDLVALGYDPANDAFDLVDTAERGIAAIMNSTDRGKISTVASTVAKSLKRIEDLQGKDSSITGVASGYSPLDNITHGWQPTDLIILAARPSVGKTALALNLARNAAMNDVPTAIFSLEMSEDQLTQRLLASESGVFLERIATGQLSEEENRQVYLAGGKLSNAPLFIDDTPALNIFELRAKCRRLKNKHHIGFIIIDYLQLMSGTENRNGNREQEISRISRDLKGLAKELKVPIIALSQLSRAVESRNDKTPQLSDLRESGAIEQDADMVMFLYRPEYYGITANESGESNKGETHIKIAKHRNGSLDLVKLQALLHIQRFVEYEAQPFTPPAPEGQRWRPVRVHWNEKNDDLV